MGRPRGCLWLTVGLLVALVAGVVAFMALSRATAQRSGTTQEVVQVEVIVAAGRVPVRSVLTAENLRVKQIPVSAVPEGALQQASQAEGKITTVELFPEEVLLAQRVVDPNVIPADGRMALALDGDQVLMAFDAEDLMSKVGVLKAGDHVDLLATLAFPVNRGVAGGGGAEEQPASFSLLQNLTIAAIIGGPAPSDQGAKAEVSSQASGAPSAVLLTISAQDALTLKYLRDEGGRVDIVLRAPGAEGPFSVEPVDWNYLIDKFKIPISGGR
jgi:Flp pilus assembly protein CpaB